MSQAQQSSKEITIALSGGGFRAMLFHLGVLRAIRDVGRLGDVRCIVSVSGGSVLAAHLVLNWEQYVRGDFAEACRPILRFAQAGIRNRILRRYPVWMVGHYLPKSLAGLLRSVHSLPGTPTELLAKHYNRLLYRGATLKALHAPGLPQLHILATNLSRGAGLSAFTADGYFDGTRLHRTQVPLVAYAVAASSAYPGFFPPLHADFRRLGLAHENALDPKSQALTDGGVFDNLGLRYLYRLRPQGAERETIISDASAKFRDRIEYQLDGPVRTALRAVDILTYRIAALEREHAELVDAASTIRYIRLQNVVDCRPGMHAEGSASGVAALGAWDAEALPTNVQEILPYVRTDLDDFTPVEIDTLTHHGWVVGRQCLGRAPGLNEPFRPLGEPAHYPHSVILQLQDAANRRIKPLAWNDGCSYLYVAGAAVILGLVLWAFLIAAGVIRAPQAVATERRAREAVPRLRDQLRHMIEGRCADNGILSRPDAEANSVETWGSSQAAYALLCSAVPGDHELLERIRGLLLARFAAGSDYIGAGQGWYERPAEKHPRADPCLWMTMAVARWLRLNPTSPHRPEMEQRLRECCDAAAQYCEADSGWWYVYPDEELRATKGGHQPYTAVLGMVALLELSACDAPVQVCSMEPDALLLKTARTLASDFALRRPDPGWIALGAAMSDNEPSEPFDLLAFSVLLEVERQHSTAFALDAAMLAAIQSAVDSAALGMDTTERLILSRSQSVTSLLWRPWAVACRVRWIDRLQRTGADDARVVTTRESLNGIVLALERYVHKLENDYTFRAAELLIALQELRAPAGAGPLASRPAPWVWTVAGGTLAALALGAILVRARRARRARAA